MTDKIKKRDWEKAKKIIANHSHQTDSSTGNDDEDKLNHIDVSRNREKLKTGDTHAKIDEIIILSDGSRIRKVCVEKEMEA